MENHVFNIDCMEAMKETEDNYYDLAIVDPPYGAGFTEGGGCKGWFTKYHHPSPENERGGLLEIDTLQTVNEKGTSHTSFPKKEKKKNTKKFFRGMLRRNRNTLKNCFASHAIRSYGVGIISTYRLHDAF